MKLITLALLLATGCATTGVVELADTKPTDNKMSLQDLFPIKVTKVGLRIGQHYKAMVTKVLRKDGLELYQTIIFRKKDQMYVFIGDAAAFAITEDNALRLAKAMVDELDKQVEDVNGTRL